MEEPLNSANFDHLKQKYSKAKIRIERLLAEIVEKTLENNRLHDQIRELQKTQPQKSPFPSLQFRKHALDEESQSRIQELTESNNELRLRLNDCSFSLKSLVEKLEEKIERETMLENEVSQLKIRLKDDRHQRSFSTNDFEITAFRQTERPTHREKSANKENLIQHQRVDTSEERGMKCLSVKANDIRSLRSRERSIRHPSMSDGLSTLSHPAIDDPIMTQPHSKKTLDPDIFQKKPNKNLKILSFESGDTRVKNIRKEADMVPKQELVQLTEFYEAIISDLNKKVAELETMEAQREKDAIESQIVVKKLKLENLTLRSKVIPKLEEEAHHKRGSHQVQESTTFEQPTSEVEVPKPEPKVIPPEPPKVISPPPNSAEKEKFIELMKQAQEGHMAEIKLLMDTIQMLEERLEKATTELLQAQKKLEEGARFSRFQSAKKTSAQKPQLRESHLSSSLSETGRSSVGNTSGFLMLTESIVLDHDVLLHGKDKIVEQTIKCLEERVSQLVQEKLAIESEAQAKEVKHRTLLCNFQELTQELRKAQKNEEEAKSILDEWKAKYSQIQFRFNGLSKDYLEMKDRSEKEIARLSERKTEPKKSMFEAFAQTDESLLSSPFGSAGLGGSAKFSEAYNKQIEAMRCKIEDEVKLKNDKEIRQIKQGMEIKYKWEMQAEIKKLEAQFERKKNLIIEEMEEKAAEVSARRISEINAEWELKTANSNKIQDQLISEMSKSIRLLKDELSMQVETVRQYKAASELANSNSGANKHMDSFKTQDTLGQATQSELANSSSEFANKVRKLEIENEIFRQQIGDLNDRVAKSQTAQSEMADELTAFSFREFSMQEELNEKSEKLKSCLLQMALYKSELLRLSRPPTARLAVPPTR